MATKPKQIRLAVRKEAASGGSGKAMEGRRRSADEYHTWRWTKASRAYRAAHPLCAECLKRGLYVPAEVVDHIVPVALCTDFWDETNWQSLCQRCNIDKGNRDKALIRGGRR